jgi:hypothetical protein
MPVDGQRHWMGLRVPSYCKQIRNLDAHGKKKDLPHISLNYRYTTNQYFHQRLVCGSCKGIRFQSVQDTLVSTEVDKFVFRFGTNNSQNASNHLDGKDSNWFRVSSQESDEGEISSCLSKIFNNVQTTFENTYPF